MPILRRILRAAALLTLAAGSGLAAAEPVALPAPEWIAVSGDWKITDGRIAELSDGVAPGDRPLWSTAGSPAWKNYLFRARVSTADGVGSLYLAARWRNQDNCYAVRYSDPHRVLELLRIVDGRETVLARAEGAGEASPQKQPLELSIRVEGNRLTAKAGKVELSAVADAFSSGAVAVGTSHRQGFFDRCEVELLPEKSPARELVIEPEFRRRVFRPEEKEIPLVFRVLNPTGVRISGAEFRMRIDAALPEEKWKLPALAPGKAAEVKLLFPAGSLRSADYAVSCEVVSAEGKSLAATELLLSVVPPENPARFPLLLWDGIDSGEELARLGFTASAVPSFFFVSGFAQEKEKQLERTLAAVERNEEYLRNGVASLLKIDTRRYWDKKQFADLLMKNASDKLQLSGDICHNHPAYRRALEESLEALGRRLEGSPSVRLLLFDSETENEERKLFQCFHPECLALAKQAGFDPLPAGVNRVWGMVGASLYGKKDHPAVLPDHSPEFDFIRWWWLNGSGFVESRARAAEILKKHLPEARTFHDPILRNPAFLGRDRGMDFVSHWTYTNPSPLAVLENIDEMEAAVGGKKPVVPNLQLFWYTNEVVGELTSSADKKKAAEEAASFVEARDAIHFGRFMTISPDHLREALWLALSRPVEAIMLDGGSAISTTPGTYAATNPDTAEALAEFSDRVLRPYGPMLRKMTGSPARVAMLQSVYSSLYGRTGNYGNANRIFADVYNSAILAQLQPRILYEESLGELEKFEVLLVPDTRFLSESGFAAVKRFLESGRTVITDTGSRIPLAGIVKLPFEETAKLSAADREAAWRRGAKLLLKTLEEKKFQRLVSSPSDNLVISRRLGDGDQAIFLINDSRTAGDYVGRFGKVLEAGVPQRAEVKFSPELTAQGRVLYDVAARRKVVLEKGGAAFFLPPGGGRLLYLASAELTGLKAKIAPTVRRGEKIRLRAELLAAGPVKGTQALEVELRDSAGRRHVSSGYYCLTNGVFELKIPIARNDRAGYWTVICTDLIAGHRAEAAFQVMP